MQYISLHGYIRNTPSDAESRRTLPESRQESLTTGKEYIDPKLSRTKEGRGKEENEQDWTCTWGEGN